MDSELARSSAFQCSNWTVLSGAGGSHQQATGPHAECGGEEGQQNEPRVCGQPHPLQEDPPDMGQGDQSKDRAGGNQIGFHAKGSVRDEDLVLCVRPAGRSKPLRLAREPWAEAVPKCNRREPRHEPSQRAG